MAQIARDRGLAPKPTSQGKGKSQGQGKGKGQSQGQDKGKGKEKEGEGSETNRAEIAYYFNPFVPIESRMKWNTDWKHVTDKSIPDHENLHYVKPKDPKDGVVVIRERLPGL